MQSAYVDATNAASTSGAIGLWGALARVESQTGIRTDVVMSEPRRASCIFTNITGDGRINACNVNGCSGLTLDAVMVSHQPQCGRH